MTRNIPSAIASGAFVKHGESVAIIGERSDTYPTCSSIVETCKNAGMTVHVLMGETEMASARFDSPAATSDLLFVWQLPTDSSDEVGMGTAWSAGKALSAVLFQRAERGKSTLLASCERPRDWALRNRLGQDTFWTAASVGIGLLLNADDPSHQPFFARSKVPPHHINRALFEQQFVVSMDCVTDPAVLAMFDRDSYRPDWHWVDFWQKND